MNWKRFTEALSEADRCELVAALEWHSHGNSLTPNEAELSEWKTCHWIGAIKAYRFRTGLGLKETKELFERTGPHGSTTLDTIVSPITWNVGLESPRPVGE